MTDANIRDPSPQDSTPRLPLQESEPRVSIVEPSSNQVLNGSHIGRQRPWSRGILPDDIPEYQRQVMLRLSKAHEAGVQWSDIQFDAVWCLPWWEGIDAVDLKPGEGQHLERLVSNSEASNDSIKEAETVPDQHIKALKELFEQKLSGDNRYHESLTQLKEMAEMLDGYPVAKQDFEDAIQPVREAIDAWHEIFAKMGAREVPIAEADLVSEFANAISPFLGLPADSTKWVDFLRKLIRLKEWDLIDKFTSVQVYGIGYMGQLSKTDLDEALLVVKNEAHFRYLIWAEKFIKSYEADDSDLMDTENRRKVDQKPPSAKLEKDEDIVTEEPAPEQPIGDKSHSDDREDEDATAIDTSLWEPFEDPEIIVDHSLPPYRWMSDSEAQEYLRIVAEQSKESESEPTASQSNPRTDEADDEMIIDEETLNNMFAGWIGHMPIPRGLDEVEDEEVEDEEEEGAEEARWFTE